jgi:hypothetical protein
MSTLAAGAGPGTEPDLLAPHTVSVQSFPSLAYSYNPVYAVVVVVCTTPRL